MFVLLFPSVEPNLMMGNSVFPPRRMFVSAGELKSTRTFVDMVSSATRLDRTCALSWGR